MCLYNYILATKLKIIMFISLWSQLLSHIRVGGWMVKALYDFIVVGGHFLN
jgi:hypothetical protein